MYKKLVLGLTVAFLSVGLPWSATASLLGQEVTCSSSDFSCVPSSAVVDAISPEFILGDNNGRSLFEIDMGESTAGITNIFPSGLGQLLDRFSFLLGDLLWAEDATARIIGIQIISEGIVGSVVPVLGLTDNDVTIRFRFLDSWVPGGFAEFTFIPEPHASKVPEPGTFWLFGLGLALILGWMRHVGRLPAPKVQRPQPDGARTPLGNLAAA